MVSSAKVFGGADDPDFTPRKSDIARLKSDARSRDKELQSAYESGREEGALSVRGPRGAKLSFSSDSQKLIVIAMTITVIVASIESVHNPTGKQSVPITRIVLGGFVSGAILLAMSYFIPEFASGLAVVAMTATIFDRGKPFWDVVSSVSKTGPAITGGSGPSTPTTAGELNRQLSPTGGNLPGGENLSPSGNLPGGGSLSPAGELPVSASSGPTPYHFV